MTKMQSFFPGVPFAQPSPVILILFLSLFFLHQQALARSMAVGRVHWELAGLPHAILQQA